MCKWKKYVIFHVKAFGMVPHFTVVATNGFLVPMAPFIANTTGEFDISGTWV
jgi:hypothetical protein